METLRQRHEGGSIHVTPTIGRFWHPPSRLVVQSGPKTPISSDAVFPHGRQIASRSSLTIELRCEDAPLHPKP